MKLPPLPPRDTERIEALRRYGVIDTAPDEALDELAAIAAEVTSTPIALIAFVDETRQWFKSHTGLELSETARHDSFSAHHLDSPELFVVEDAADDPRFAGSLLVASHGVRFYAGVPLLTPDRWILGALCVLDRRPRRLSARQVQALFSLSRQVMTRLEMGRQQVELAERERRLRDNQTTLARTQALAKIGSWELDLASGKAVWSDETYRIFERDPSQPPTRDVFVAALHPADRERVLRDSDRIVASQSAFQDEFRILTPQAGVRWVEVHVDVIRAGGQPVTLIGTTQDITRQRLAEARIRQLNRVYAVLTDISTTIARGHDPTSIVAAACGIAVDVGGFCMAAYLEAQPDGTVRVAAHAGADPEAVAILERLMNRDADHGCVFTEEALRTGRHAVCNDIAQDPDAAPWRQPAIERGYLSMIALPLNVAGRTVGAFNAYASEAGFFTAEELRLLDELASNLSFALEAHRREDARAEADKQRRLAEERFRLVVETIDEVFWITNGDFTKVLYVSPAYETIWGRPIADVYAFPNAWIEMVHPDDRLRLTEAVTARLATGQFNEVFRLLRADGSVRWIHDRAYPIKDRNGALQLIVGTAADITERVQLEEQLRQSQKMESLGRLAGGIAHDFNNLLTIIGGTADLLLTNLDAHSPLRTDLEQIRLAGDRAAALTQQLLAMSRQQFLAPTVFDLREVVTGLHDILQRLIGEDIAIKVNSPPVLGNVKADPRQIEQVIFNLAVNARDAMPGGGTLSFTLADVEVTASDRDAHQSVPPGSYVVMSVSDTGHGMTAATRERVFEPFFTTKEAGKGTGLGLATAYGIIKQSGGSIAVQSEPDRGALFTIYLPRVSEPALPHPVADVAPPANGSETILLVEDEPALRAVTRRILASAGYAVVEAGSGTEALDVLEQLRGPLDLLLTDVVLPGISGRQLSEELLRRRPGIKVLYMSGYTDDAILRHGVLEEPHRFVSKPFTPAALRRRVYEALHG